MCVVSEGRQGRGRVRAMRRGSVWGAKAAGAGARARAWAPQQRRNFPCLETVATEDAETAATSSRESASSRTCLQSAARGRRGAHGGEYWLLGDCSGEGRGPKRGGLAPTVPVLAEMPAKTFCSVATYTRFAPTTAVFTWPTYFLCQLLIPTWSSYRADAVPTSVAATRSRQGASARERHGTPILACLPSRREVSESPARPPVTRLPLTTEGMTSDALRAPARGRGSSLVSGRLPRTGRLAAKRRSSTLGRSFRERGPAPCPCCPAEALSQVSA